MFKKYLEYVKDNPNKYWFKRKMYGWGWTPVKWEGWLSIIAVIIFIVLNGFTLDNKEEPSSADLNWFFIRTFIAVAVLLFICYKKGEKPSWHWGPPKNKKDDNNSN